jgi:squalene synthase HpnC
MSSARLASAGEGESAAPAARDAAAAAVPDLEGIMARAGSENFPVASRLLPRAERAHLLAIYGFARLVDELGDVHAGDRVAALAWLEGELERAYEGRAEHPLLVRLEPTLRACRLRREPFLRLIEANRLDQRVSRYESFEQLLAYCDLSANPVGELVLETFGLATATRVALSDSICTALQLTEHWQDVAEDLARDRIYLPAEDMRRFGCTEEMLRAPSAPTPLRTLLAFEVSRARALLAAGTPLLATLRGRPRIAVAGFIGGGRAALDAIERARWDVLPGAPTATPLSRGLAILRTLAGAWRSA